MAAAVPPLSPRILFCCAADMTINEASVGENDLDESCVFCFIASGRDKEAEVVKRVSV